MSFSVRRSVLPALGLVVGLTAVLAGPSSPVQGASPASSASAGAPAPRGEFEGAGGYTYPRPTNAAKVFRWGVEEWRDEFEDGSLGNGWKVRPRRQGGQQAGQITLNAGPRTGTVTARATDTRARYGRWETRMRAKQYDDRTPYRFYWELVPVGKFECGGRSVVMASYRQDQEKVRGGVRVHGDTEFAFSKRIDLRIGYFHTYAVEITPQRISWFVDRKVVRTETRPEATAGVVYQPRFRMEAVNGRTMARSRLQADWARYYDLDRPNAKSVEAPRMTKRPYERTNC